MVPLCASLSNASFLACLTTTSGKVTEGSSDTVGTLFSMSVLVMAFAVCSYWQGEVEECNLWGIMYTRHSLF